MKDVSSREMNIYGKLLALDSPEADRLRRDWHDRILFLNLVLDKEKGVTFLWKEPFSTLANSRSVKNGGDMWT